MVGLTIQDRRNTTRGNIRYEDLCRGQNDQSSWFSEDHIGRRRPEEEFSK
jgi:hypothetical protein